MSCLPHTHVDAVAPELYSTPELPGLYSTPELPELYRTPELPELYRTPEQRLAAEEEPPGVVPRSPESPRCVLRTFSDLRMYIAEHASSEDDNDTITAEDSTPAASDIRDEKLIRSIERLQTSIDDLAIYTGRNRKNLRQLHEPGVADRAGRPGENGQRGRGRWKGKSHRKTPLSYGYVEGE